MKKILFIFVVISVISFGIAGFIMKNVEQNEIQNFADKLALVTIMLK